MIINLKDDATLAQAVGGIKVWLLNSGQVNPNALCKGEDPGWKTAYKLLKEYGEGEYEVKEDGKLFKGDKMVVHNDDVKAFCFDEELSVEIKDEKKEEKPDNKDVSTLTNIRPGKKRK